MRNSGRKEQEGRASHAVAAAPPPLASAATAPARAAAPVAPPLPSPAVAATAPPAATGTPALPSHAAAVTPPLLSPAVSVTALAAAGGTLALLSLVMTPPLLSPAAAVPPPLQSPAVATETAAAAAAAAAAVPSQTAHTPPSPTGGEAGHGSGNVQCAEHSRALRKPPAEKNEEGTVGRTGSQGVTWGEATVSFTGVTSTPIQVGAGGYKSWGAFVAGSGATSPTEQLSFTLDSRASSCFFRDCTDFTPQRTPATVALADPSMGPVVAHSTTTLSCLAAPSRFLTGYYTPSISKNLGAAPSGVSQVDPVEPVEVAVDSRLAAGVEPGGAEPGGAEPWGAEPGGVEPGGAEPGGAEPEGAESGGAAPGGAEPEGAASGSPEPWGAESGGPESGGPVPTSPTPGGALSSEQLREWYFQHCSLRRGTSGARRTSGAGAGTSRRELPSRDQIRAWYERRCTLRSGAPGVTDPGAPGTTAGTEDPDAGAATGAVGLDVGAAAGAEYPDAAGAGAATGAGESGVGAATGAGDPDVGAAAGAEDPGAGDSARSGVAARRRPYFVPLLQQVLGLPPSTGSPPPSVSPQPVLSQLELRPASPLPALSPYTEPPGGLTERGEPASRPVSPVRTARTSGCGSHLRPPPIPGTHRMSLRLSTAPLRVPLPSPPESSLPVSSDPASDSLRAASPTVPRLLATVVTDPSFESTAASALVAELVDFAPRCRLDYAASLVAESEPVCPPSVGGECALSTDVLEDKQEEFQCFAAALPHLMSTLLAPEGDPDAPDIPTPRSYAEAIEGPYSSQWQAAMDAEMASWKSTGTYVDEVPPPGANIVSGMWIFRVKRPPGSPPVFKARYVARGFSFPTCTQHPASSFIPVHSIQQ
ncbi:unnamed protein product [Closterium sp. NIES-54]